MNLDLNYFISFFCSFFIGFFCFLVDFNGNFVIFAYFLVKMGRSYNEKSLKNSKNMIFYIVKKGLMRFVIKMVRKGKMVKN